jgi:hypothetical protein
MAVAEGVDPEGGGDVLGKAEWVMAEDGLKRDNENGNGGGEPSAEHHEIALAIESFRKNYEAAQSNRANHDKKTLFWARVAGIGVSIYTVLTLAIVGASIYSAKQAKISADAARATARIASDTEVRQLRAYLYVRRYPIVADQMTAAVKIELNQAGVTPAYNIRLDAMILVERYLVGAPALPDVTSQSVGSVDRTQYSILYSTENIPKVISLPPDSHEAMHLVWSKDSAIGDQRLYLFGVVRYFDIFGVEGLQPERRYEFCFVYHPDRDPIGSERGCEKHNKPG